MRLSIIRRLLAGLGLALALMPAAAAQVAVRGHLVHTMAGPAIEDGMVIVRDGKIAAVGRAADLRAPDGFRVLDAAVVTPGLIDAHATAGLSGQFNTPHDRDQIERSSPLQPELRAIDAYNPRERLVEWVRGFGVTTLHTGHAPGELISGQTMVVKTAGATVEEAALLETAMVAVTIGNLARKEGERSPGTRGKMMAMLRSRFVQAREYLEKRAAAPEGEKPPRDLGLEALGRVLRKEAPLLVTAHRAQDIASALRLAEEFGFRLVLDGAAEGYVLAERIRAAGVPIIVHPTMERATGDLENLSFENAARLKAAGISIALQSGYESYVPKTRVVLFEAAVAAANGLGREAALAAITADAARLLGIDARVGSLAVGKDGDLALYDGDPFEYTTHCIAVVIDGKVVSEAKR
jgi:imidazolonepropionase-like amidohydrolase